jgi:Polyketide cyclase / dehydrase and lipid transport
LFDTLKGRLLSKLATHLYSGQTNPWHPEVSDSSIEGSAPSDAVGCARSLYLKSGGRFRERLLTLSDREYMFTYTILESPLPMTDYVSTVPLRPVTDTDQTYAQWTSEFNCAPDVERELTKIVLGVYQGGFDSLRGKFSR